jgi:hypothetical protein
LSHLDANVRKVRGVFASGVRGDQFVGVAIVQEEDTGGCWDQASQVFRNDVCRIAEVKSTAQTSS